MSVSTNSGDEFAPVSDVDIDDDDDIDEDIDDEHSEEEESAEEEQENVTAATEQAIADACEDIDDHHCVIVDREDVAHLLADGTQYRIDEVQMRRLFDALCKTLLMTLAAHFLTVDYSCNNRRTQPSTTTTTTTATGHRRYRRPVGHAG